MATMQCVDSVKLDSRRRSSSADVHAAVSLVQQFIDVNPSPLTAQLERRLDDMLATVNNRTLDETCSTARRRCVPQPARRAPRR